MMPLVHGLVAWLFATTLLKKSNDRRLATIVGLAPDIDGVHILFNKELFYAIHHTFGHSFVFGIPLAIAVGLLSKDKRMAFIAALGAFTLHLISDIIGGNWPVQVIFPFSNFPVPPQQIFSNHVIYNIINPVAFLLVIVGVVYVMYKKKISPLELLSEKLDKRFISIFTGRKVHN